VYLIDNNRPSGSTTTTWEAWPSSNTSRTSEFIMSLLLIEKIPAKPPWAAFLNKVQESLSALLARHLRQSEAELIALHDRCSKIIGLDRSKIGSVLITQERTNCVRQQRWHAATRN
jgi:hypothetical protein